MFINRIYYAIRSHAVRTVVSAALSFVIKFGFSIVCKCLIIYIILVHYMQFYKCLLLNIIIRFRKLYIHCIKLNSYNIFKCIIWDLCFVRGSEQPSISGPEYYTPTPQIISNITYVNPNQQYLCQTIQESSSQFHITYHNQLLFTHCQCAWNRLHRAYIYKM